MMRVAEAVADMSNGDLVQTLFKKGDVVTADAMNTQHKLLNLIHEKRADFCFPVKGTTIANEERFLLTTADESCKRFFETLDAGHGRV